MGPFELLYSWQAILCAIACIGVTQLVKTIIDTIYEKRWEKMDAERQKKVKDSLLPDDPNRGTSKMGKVVRKQSVIVTRFVLPLMPIFVGAAYAMVVPFLPDVIVEWVSSNDHVPQWKVLVGLAAWGGACGQFADYLYTKAKKTMESVAER